MLAPLERSQQRRLLNGGIQHSHSCIRIGDDVENTFVRAHEQELVVCIGGGIVRELSQDRSINRRMSECTHELESQQIVRLPSVKRRLVTGPCMDKSQTHSSSSDQRQRKDRQPECRPQMRTLPVPVTTMASTLLLQMREDRDME